MSGTPPDQPAEVTIGRLVFDIPGLDPAQAAGLASDVAGRLSRAGLSGARAGIAVTLGPADGSQADLASRIAAALMQRFV